MPRGDRTGPMGMGPMSGRAAGYCGGFDAPGRANPGPGRGGRWGFGRGRGGAAWGRRGGFGGPRRGPGFAGPDWTPWGAFGVGYGAEAERQVLKSRADVLRAELRAVESRLAGSEENEEKEKPE